ncbi:MAG TPA: hypothetical protein VGM44_08045 [Polyangiaceae bacterium]
MREASVTAPSGWRIAWFEDPDSNVLSIAEHPGCMREYAHFIGICSLVSRRGSLR